MVQTVNFHIIPLISPIVSCDVFILLTKHIKNTLFLKSYILGKKAKTVICSLWIIHTFTCIKSEELKTSVKNRNLELTAQIIASYLQCSEQSYLAAPKQPWQPVVCQKYGAPCSLQRIAGHIWGVAFTRVTFYNLLKFFSASTYRHDYIFALLGHVFF